MKTILITGGRGFLGQHVLRQFPKKNFIVDAPSHDRVDMLDVNAVWRWFGSHQKVDGVIHLAANCGGILANQHAPGDMYADNIVMAANVIKAAARFEAKLVLIGTACSYSPDAPVPSHESNIGGELYGDTSHYGRAKLAMLDMARAYRIQENLHFSYLIPSNIYGPGDHFYRNDAHVIPSLVRRFAENTTVDIWGDAEVTRDFVYVTDVARAIYEAWLTNTGGHPINISSGKETSMLTVAQTIGEHFDERVIRWDWAAPVGHTRRCLDNDRAKDLLGWKPKVGFKAGIAATVADFQKRALTPTV
jgi:GDP-L-fucose synthase